MQGGRWYDVAGLSLLLVGLLWPPLIQSELLFTSDAFGALYQPTSGPSGNLALLSSFVMGIGAFLLARGRGESWWRSGLVGAAAYVIATILLPHYPNYLGLAEARIATISQSFLLTNFHASPVVMGSILFMIVALAAFICRIRLGTRALALPVAVTLVVGSVYQLAVVSGHPNALLAVHATLQLGASLALLVSILLQEWFRFKAVEEVRYAILWQERSYSARLVQIGSILGILVLAVASVALPKLSDPAFEAGSVLIFALRSHSQAIGFLALLILPHAIRPVDVDSVWRRPLIVEGSLLGLGAILLAIPAIGPLWGFTILLLAGGISAWMRKAFQPAGFWMLLAMLPLWGIANSIRATYDGLNFPALELDPNLSILAILRVVTAAGIILAYALVERRLARIASFSLVALLATTVILPLHVFYEPGAGIDTVGAGSLLRSMTPPLRFSVVSFFVLAYAAWLLIRLPASRRADHPSYSDHIPLSHRE